MRIFQALDFITHLFFQAENDREVFMVASFFTAFYAQTFVHKNILTFLLFMPMRKKLKRMHFCAAVPRKNTVYQYQNKEMREKGEKTSPR